MNRRAFLRSIGFGSAALATAPVVAAIKSLRSERPQEAFYGPVVIECDHRLTQEQHTRLLEQLHQAMNDPDCNGVILTQGVHYVGDMRKPRIGRLFPKIVPMR
jgi:hypothetical protein